jgi:hypothetical protein
MFLYLETVAQLQEVTTLSIASSLNSLSEVRMMQQNKIKRAMLLW